MILELIKSSLWNTQVEDFVVTEEDYQEMKAHAIVALPASILSKVAMPNDIRANWQSAILHQIAYNVNCRYVESRIPILVPYLILKGTSAAQYYLHPEYRTLGDIDIITRREDFDTAYQELLDNGYRVVKELDREIGLAKNDVMIELHHRFALLNDPIRSKYLDDIILENINPTHVLPDLVNGLVLIEHINQHLEGGLGLRHIIDWMMFVNKCLTDDHWPAFYDMAEKIGLGKLSIVCTRMCEIYLGLSEHTWCKDADTALCKDLMDYVLACGNFGNKKISDADIAENVFAYASTPKMVFQLLQKRGLANWKAAKKYSFLRPFAWIYQAFRYAFRGLRRDEATVKLKDEYNNAKRRNAMFEALGVKTAAKGRVIYKNGEYIKV